MPHLVRSPLALAAAPNITYAIESRDIKAEAHINYTDRHIRPFQCECRETSSRKDLPEGHHSMCPLARSSSPGLSSVQEGQAKRTGSHVSKLERACKSANPSASRVLMNDAFANDKHHACQSPRNIYSGEKSHKRDNGGIVQEILEIEHAGHQNLAPSTTEHVLSDIAPCGIDMPLHYIHDRFILFSDKQNLETMCSSMMSTTASELHSHNHHKATCHMNYLKRVDSSSGLACNFECGTDVEREIYILEMAYCNDEAWEAPLDPITDSRTLEQSIKSFSELRYLGDPLRQTTEEIVRLLERVTKSKSEGEVELSPWSSSLEDACLKFFAPPNLRRFLNLFWGSWYPNCPIIHKPSFATRPVSGVLFITITLIGACLSPSELEKDFSKRLLDYLEEAVFANWSEDDVPGRSRNRFATSKPRLQVLQAMVLVCVLQNWEGTVASKRRIRYLRYPSVITAARRFQAGTATHRGFQWDSATNSWWHHFIAKEELIRTLIFVSLLDTAFALFWDVPPRMTITELHMDIACPEECFQAENAEACFQQICLWSISQAQPGSFSVRNCVRRLCDLSTTQNDTSIGGLSTLNMFILITSLHLLVLNLQKQGFSASSEERIGHALRSWRALWNDHNLDSDFPNNGFLSCEPWRRVGFMQYALEYWNLACLVLERTRNTGHKDHFVEASGDRHIDQYKESV
ncbi:hypothetical protein PENSTE_c002G09532 [Penicillium steckii]|uniref:Xylanolytic transcriptional activator regulatory domain-containing protein n=1 Tax=Penicillium steckii TaxID=303698 RepID=A0A1V6TUV6_9EURO|nr:hypothetical protein PENSTE_c002G09532 [Penicillium steckii]